jgi:dihydroflavonol-4-reductase
MRVAVTGATGFVGSHTTEALLAAGHEVRLLVRDPARISPAFEPLDVHELDDIVIGDITSPTDVETLLDGCDAVVHAASIYSLDPRDALAIRATNVMGTRHVIETGRRLGLDPIVHVSSMAAILPADGPAGPDTPPTADPPGVYSRSKVDSEIIARQHQAAGAPVVTIMPATIWGPNDPHFGESCLLASNYLRGRLRLLASGGNVGIVDVRDVAAAIANCIAPQMGPRRYALEPYLLSQRELSRHLNRLTGRNIRTFVVPDVLVRASLLPTDLLQRVLPGRLPLSSETVRASLNFVAVNSSRAATELGLTWRSLDESFSDTITSMVEHGQLEAKHAGMLAPA